MGSSAGHAIPGAVHLIQQPINPLSKKRHIKSKEVNFPKPTNGVMGGGKISRDKRDFSRLIHSTPKEVGHNGLNESIHNGWE